MKKEIQTVNTGVLNSRYCHLLQKGERIPAPEFSMGEAREVLWIEDELHQRAIRAVGHDFYPPEAGAKPTMADLRARLSPFKKSTPALPAPRIIHPCSAVVTKKAEMKKEGSLRFKIVITSSIGSVVKTENVKVDARSEADAEAVEMIRNLGLKKATYKIS